MGRKEKGGSQMTYTERETRLHESLSRDVEYGSITLEEAIDKFEGETGKEWE
jgi:hypothetical protein